MIANCGGRNCQQMRTLCQRRATTFRLIERREIVAQGVFDKTRQMVDVELAHDAGAVRSYGGVGDSESCTDFNAGESVGE